MERYSNFQCSNGILLVKQWIFCLIQLLLDDDICGLYVFFKWWILFDLKETRKRTKIQVLLQIISFFFVLFACLYDNYSSSTNFISSKDNKFGVGSWNLEVYLYCYGELIRPNRTKDNFCFHFVWCPYLNFIKFTAGNSKSFSLVFLNLVIL